MIRSPAVAGLFYPADAAEANAQLDELMPVSGESRPATALVVPHAGWRYSGRTAGIAYARAVIPDRVILIGPNHHGVGAPYALYDAGRWRTPLGDVPVAEPLAAELLDASELLAEDYRAHSREHSLEVQLPFLLRRNPAVRIVPLVIGGSWPGEAAELREIGEAIAQTVRAYGQPVLLIASTDLNHYEDQATSNIKDRLVLDAITQLDEDGLLQRVREVEVSMCGVAPTYVVIHAAKRLRARHAELLDYRTSGDVTGDYASVVGYGAVAITA